MIYKSDLETDIANSKYSASDFVPHLSLKKSTILLERDKKKGELQVKTRGLSDVPGMLNRIGDVKGLTLLIDFADEPATMAKTEIEDFVNKTGYSNYSNKGSVKDYFYDVSHGKLIYTNHVTAYYRAAQPKSYYDIEGTYAKAQELVQEALKWLDNTQDFDFSQLSNDNGAVLAVNVMYAGTPDAGWGTGLWPHSGWLNTRFTSNDGVSVRRYQMSDINDRLSIGTFCHENGHLLMGWADLYDYDDDSNGTGRYCLMSYTDNKNPLPPNAYFRYRAGWETAMSLNDLTIGITCSLVSNSNQSYWYFNTANKNEFFIIESRNKVGRNSGIGDGGLLIWHVDALGSNNNQDMTAASHYEVSVEQADGLSELEKNINNGADNDLFHLGYRTEFNDNTTPNAHWWNGSVSGLVIHEISNKGTSMTFKYGVGAVTTYFLQVSAGTNGFVSPQTAPYLLGEVATVTARAANGYVFDYWSGDTLATTNPLKVNMNKSKSLVANFRQAQQFTLNLESQENGIASALPQAATYLEQTSATITAHACVGSQFLGWTGDEVSSQNPLSILMDANKNITAQFGETIEPNIYEFENGIYQSSVAVVQSSTAGYSGTGYLNPNNVLGSWGEVQAYTCVEEEYTARLFYSTTSTRTVDVVVNGVTLIQNLNLPALARNSWGWVEFKINLTSGMNNIRIVGTTTGGAPSIDKLELKRNIVLQTQSMQLQKGWNLVSFYIRSADMSPTSVFANSKISILKNDTVYWKANSSSYLNLLKTIIPGSGYLLYTDQAEEINIQGTIAKIVAPQEIKQGQWQLMGAGSENQEIDALPFDFELLKNFDGFYEVGSAQNSLYLIEPGNAYYVK
ncbi:MAG: M6 family metalloprotease domain-containing protein [Bacteroidales bacterium]|nr:M6 family metalloprotease domain-containing protein [Bacteroidales bacterium]